MDSPLRVSKFLPQEHKYGNFEVVGLLDTLGVTPELLRLEDVDVSVVFEALVSLDVSLGTDEGELLAS